MGEIVVTKNFALRLRAADTFDHRIMIELIRKNEAIGQQIANRRNRRQIGNPARRKDECRLLAVKAGQFGFELDEGMVGARNIARAAGTGPMPHRGGRHGLDHPWMPAHAEIVVGTPNHDFVDAFRAVPQGARKRLCVPFEVGEDPVAAFLLQP